jgi:SAM-dependent methyltransferase
MKFNIIDSSTTWYGAAKQIERQLIDMGNIPSIEEDSISLCYANDLGSIDPYSMNAITPQNRYPLKRALESKAQFLFYNQKSCMNWFQSKTNNFYLPLAINSNIYKIYKDIERVIDIGYIGKSYPVENRFKFLNTIQQLPNLKAIHIDKDIFFEEAARCYNQCKIVVNDAQANEINMRVFEATACNALLITKHVPFLEELFIYNKEIIVYDSLEELKEKIEFYLKHDSEREKIAYQGFKKTHQAHTYYERCKFIVNKVKGDKSVSFLSDIITYKQTYENLFTQQPMLQERLFDNTLPDGNIKYNIRSRMEEVKKLCYGDVLDVGTQKGGYLFHIKNNSKVISCVGIDISEAYIQEAKKRQPDLNFIVGSIEKLPFFDKSFDTVIASEILEHILDLNVGICELKRVVKDTGQILITVPDYDYREVHEHIRNFTRFDFIQLFNLFQVEFIDIPNCLNILIRITKNIS